MNYKSFLMIVVLCTTINSTKVHGLSFPPDILCVSPHSLLSI